MSRGTVPAHGLSTKRRTHRLLVRLYTRRQLAKHACSCVSTRCPHNNTDTSFSRLLCLRARDHGVGSYLEADGEMESTYKFKQEDIKGAVHQQVARKQLDLKLDQLGPYKCRFDRGGQYVPERPAARSDWLAWG